MEIPDVHWAKDIVQIENPILREREIEPAKKLIEKEDELNARIESGELSRFDAESEKPKHLNTRLTFHPAGTIEVPISNDSGVPGSVLLP